MVRNADTMTRCLQAHHIVIVGATGSGKTYFAAAYSHYPRHCIILNPQAERVISQAADVTVETDDPEEIYQALAEPQTASVDWIPPLDTDSTLVALESMRDDLFTVRKNHPHPSPSLTVIIDEADVYAPKSGYSPVNGFFQRGRRYGIQAVAITQRPQLLSHTALTQADRHIIFRTNQYELEYYNKKGIKIDSAWLDKPYHYLEVDQFGGIIKKTPV